MAHYDPDSVKLGCMPSRRDRRTLQLGNYAPARGITDEGDERAVGIADDLHA